MRAIKSIAIAAAIACAQTSFADNGYTGNAWNGSGCTYPTSVVFGHRLVTLGMGGGLPSFVYQITTNGVTQTMNYYGQGAFWYGLNCTLSYTRNQTVIFEMKGTNFFQHLGHAGLAAKLNVPAPDIVLGEGPIFWGPNAGPATRPAVQIEKYAVNWSERTGTVGPLNPVTQGINYNSTDLNPPGDFPKGLPTLVDGVTYRVWVDANYDGTQVWVLDPSGNTAVRSTWLANVVDRWDGSQSVDPYQFGIGFFAIPQAPFPVGATLEITNISVSN